MIDEKPRSHIAGAAKLSAIALIVAVIGLPINHILNYTLLASAILLVVAGNVRLDGKRWLLAGAVALVSALATTHFAPPQIEEGENVFLTDVNKPDTVFKRELPPDVFKFMAAQFNKTYPLDKRCGQAAGCWRRTIYPKRLFAFSADGIYDSPKFSRRVSQIDFADPTWLRLGFPNDLRYNWYWQNSDVRRGHHDMRPLSFFHRWRLMMPWFVMYVFPKQFVGSQFCWRGDVLWEQASGHFVHEGHPRMSCQELRPRDTGRRIFGIAIRPESLAITLKPTTRIALLQTLHRLLMLGAVAAILLLLVRCPFDRIKLPLFLLALALILILLSDASLLGGFRYHDGGDDGLGYESYGRHIVQFLLAGDIFHALRGGADVFYFNPGFRYFRAVERLIFGETNFGYVSLLLVMPLLAWNLFRRFLPPGWTLALTILFFITPVGLLFGSNYFLYIQNASRGYGGGAAAILFLGGLLLLIGGTAEGPHRQRFGSAFFASLLMAIAVPMRPNIAPAVAILLGGAGLAALWWRQIRRLLGLCVGFLPIFLCAVHNWYYGGVLVLMSKNGTLPIVYTTHPSDFLQALSELVQLQIHGEHLHRVARSLFNILSGPREWLSMVPFHIAATAVLFRVALARRYDPWLRLTASSAIIGLSVGLFFAISPRDVLVFWLLMTMIVAVWLCQEGLPFLSRQAPGFVRAISGGPLWQKAEQILAASLDLIGAK